MGRQIVVTEKEFLKNAKEAWEDMNRVYEITEYIFLIFMIGVFWFLFILDTIVTLPFRIIGVIIKAFRREK